MQRAGPADAGDDDEHAKHLDPAPHHADGLIGNRFESLKGDRIIHIGTFGNTWPGSRAAFAKQPGSTFGPTLLRLNARRDGGDYARRHVELILAVFNSVPPCDPVKLGIGSPHLAFLVLIDEKPH